MNENYRFTDEYRKASPEERKLFDSFAAMSPSGLAFAAIGSDDLYRSWIASFIPEVDSVGPHPDFVNWRMTLERISLKVSATLWRFYGLGMHVELVSMLQALAELCQKNQLDFEALLIEGNCTDLINTPDEPDERLVAQYFEQLELMMFDWIPQLRVKETSVVGDGDMLNQILEIEQLFEKQAIENSLAKLQLEYLQNFFKAEKEAMADLQKYQKNNPTSEFALPEPLRPNITRKDKDEPSKSNGLNGSAPH